MSPKIFDTAKAREAQERRFSKAGDPRRQGRVELPQRELVAFVELGGRIEARLGVVSVGEIRANPCGGRHEFFWQCHLPACNPAPRPAGDVEKAKSALLHRVREWCEAARLVPRREASR